MDTNDKNRDERRTQQGEKPRAAQSRQPQSRRKEPQKAAPEKRTSQAGSGRKETAKKQGAQRSAAQKRENREEAGQKRTAQRDAAQKRSPQQRSEGQKAPARDGGQARQHRAEPQTEAESRRQRPQQSTAQRRSPEQQSVLQGGPHQRAAKQPSSRQRPARQQSQRKPVQSRTVKKNPLQSFIAGVRGNKERTPDQEAKARERRQKRAAEAERKRKQAERNNTPAVIYTAPQAFNRNRLLVQLITVMAVVAALIMGMSVFFKVKTITVAGAEVYDAYSVQDASGIQKGDKLLTFSRERASAQIYAKLGYVEKVRIGIKLPDTVIIYIEEADVAYAIQSSDGTWWLMTSGGRVAEQIDTATKESYTQVLGVTLDNPEPGKNAVAKEDVPTETDEAGELIPVTVTGAQRLNSALQILVALEANDIVGSAASVDVSRLDDIILWYGSQYQVNLGDTSKMEYKIACMNDAILQLSDYQTGILDISFITWPDQVGYTPFG